MNPESENFEQLRQLLALKRHEVPPPGYFNNFSRDVISRIRVAGAEASAPRTSWFQRFMAALQPKPAFAGAFGLGVCALLVAGIFYSAQIDGQPLANNHLDSNNSFAALAGDSTSPLPLNQASVQPTLAAGVNPLAGAPQTSGSLFDQFQIQVQPASFHPNGN